MTRRVWARRDCALGEPSILFWKKKKKREHQLPLSEEREWERSQEAQGVASPPPQSVRARGPSLPTHSREVLATFSLDHASEQFPQDAAALDLQARAVKQPRYQER